MNPLEYFVYCRVRTQGKKPKNYVLNFKNNTPLTTSLATFTLGGSVKARILCDLAGKLKTVLCYRLYPILVFFGIHCSYTMLNGRLLFQGPHTLHLNKWDVLFRVEDRKTIWMRICTRPVQV